MTSAQLPDNFILGAATSAYQIEGAWDAGGKGESIWDRFAHTAGAIEDASTGDVACDHIRRWGEDVALMSSLGLDAYRFSVSWPRVLPLGTGKVNQAGLDFYDRLVDALLAAAIRPFVTLYHWDLPQALQDRGGWPSRATVDAFCDYARTIARRLGDRVKDWITLNEPSVSAYVGHFEGRHAPGHRSEEEALAALHHLLLAHGRAVPILRNAVDDANVGITIVLYPIHPASSNVQDTRAARSLDGLMNRTFLDSLSGRGYPTEVAYTRSILDSFVHDGDLEEIARPIDFLGVNYYTRLIAHQIAAAPSFAEPRGPLTDMGWEIYPEGLVEVFDRLHTDYRFPAYHITENGAAYPDVVDADGRIRDPDRIEYLRAHLAQVARIVESGIPLRGYFAWSLLDNFEWAHGFRKRFGLVYVDFETGLRTPKESFDWYRRVIASRSVA